MINRKVQYYDPRNPSDILSGVVLDRALQSTKQYILNKYEAARQGKNLGDEGTYTYISQDVYLIRPSGTSKIHRVLPKNIIRLDE